MKYIYSHSPYSNGAKQLANAMGIKRIRHKNSKFKGGRDKVVINWGCSKLPKNIYPSLVINRAGDVACVANKLIFFNSIVDFTENEPIPEYTQHIEFAEQWIREGNVVVCRTLLNSSGGKGIVIANTIDELVEAPLYVQYKKKKDEYRVHIVGGNVIDVQRKARDLNNLNPNWMIRNHANGFIYAREGVEAPEKVIEAAMECFLVTGLAFGAVDVIWNDYEQRAYVLEINSAPGLVGSTIGKYADALDQYIKDYVE